MPPAPLAELTAVVSRFGSAVRLERVAGTFTPKIAGGDLIYGGQYRCTVGFHVRDSSNVYYFVTAGHCGNIASTWCANSAHTTVVGTTAGSSFPGNDYALVKYTNLSLPHPGSVDLCNGSYQDITSVGEAYVAESVKRAGCFTGVHSGAVLAVNATVNYAEGTVTGLIKTNICAEGGDSGGPLFDGTKALGICPAAAATARPGARPTSSRSPSRWRRTESASTSAPRSFGGSAPVLNSVNRLRQSSGGLGSSN